MRSGVVGHLPWCDDKVDEREDGPNGGEEHEVYFGRRRLVPVAAPPVCDCEKEVSIYTRRRLQSAKLFLAPTGYAMCDNTGQRELTICRQTEHDDREHGLDNADGQNEVVGRSRRHLLVLVAISQKQPTERCKS